MKKHYNILYYQLNPIIQCATCKAKPKTSRQFYHQCKKISAHFSVVIGYNVTIKPTDYICPSCYFTHILVLKSLKDEPTFHDGILQCDIDK